MLAAPHGLPHLLYILKSQQMSASMDEKLAKEYKIDNEYTLTLKAK